MRKPDVPLEVLRLEPDFDPQLYNIATDAVVEETLGAAGAVFPLGNGGVRKLLKETFGMTVSATKARRDYSPSRLYRMLKKHHAAQAT